MASSKYRLEEWSKRAWLKGEISYSIVGFLQGLSEGSSRRDNYTEVGGTREDLLLTFPFFHPFPRPDKISTKQNYRIDLAMAIFLNPRDHDENKLWASLSLFCFTIVLYLVVVDIF